jgi:hypothetical protein
MVSSGHACGVARSAASYSAAVISRTDVVICRLQACSRYTLTGMPHTVMSQRAAAPCRDAHLLATKRPAARRPGFA